MHTVHSLLRHLGTLALILFVAIPAHASDALTGEWLGTLSTPGGNLRLLVTVTASDGDGFTATLESLDQAPGQQIPITTISLTDTQMAFEIAAIGASYRGDWNADSRSYDGIFNQGAALPLSFARPDDSQAQVIEGLDGVWRGTLERDGTLLELQLNTVTTPAGTQMTLDSISQAAYGIPVTDLIRDSNTVRFRVPAANVTYEGALTISADAISGTWQRPGFDDAMVTFERVASAVTSPVRPQDPVAPLPYREQDVRFDNPAAEDVWLAGTLTLPAGDGPFPAAILISGSGPQDRDETVWTHRPFAVLADHLTRQGIAVLRYDDRGYGESTGDFASGTSMDFATDAEAALAWLETHPEIDRSAIGLIGHSEGGLIAPVIAARNESVAFIVLLAGPGTTGQEVLLDQSIASARAAGRSEADLVSLQILITQIMDAVRTAPDEAGARQALDALLTTEALAQLGATPEQKNLLINQNVRPWTRAFLRFDPAPHLAGVEQPVLALNGSLDIQVLAQPNLAGLRASLAGNRDATIIELEGLNHMFQTARTGNVAEYAQIEETFNPDALELISDWITERFAR